MGEIADSMINGEMCSQCGVYLEPKEIVYSFEGTKLRMPDNGDEMGFPVVCRDCK